MRTSGGGRPLIPPLVFSSWFVVERFPSALPMLAKAGVVAWVVSVPLAHFVCHELVPGPWFVCDLIGVGFSVVGFHVSKEAQRICTSFPPSILT
jgi:hypothetical protein